MPRSGFNGVDFEDNINFERLHSEVGGQAVLGRQ